MAELNIDSENIPEFNTEDEKRNANKEKVLDILKNLQTEDPKFQEDVVKDRLDLYDHMIKKYRKKRKAKDEAFRQMITKKEEYNYEEDTQVAEEMRKECNEEQPINEEITNDEPKYDFLASNPTTIMEICRFLEQEKLECENIEKQIGLLQEKLNEVDTTPMKIYKGITEMYENSRTNIDKFLNDFSELEKEGDEMNDSISDDSESDYEADFKVLTDLHKDISYALNRCVEF